jgi:hypothetical protein
MGGAFSVNDFFGTNIFVLPSIISSNMSFDISNYFSNFL